jgi:hypothetical protein
MTDFAATSTMNMKHVNGKRHLHTMMTLRPVQEDAVASEDDQASNEEPDDDDDESKERIRGIIFGRSVRSSYCVLHVARYLKEPEAKDADSNDDDHNNDNGNDTDDDDNLDPILIRVQFQSEDPRALRSYCRRFCKLGDLLQLRTGAWKAIDESIETEWQSPRLIVDLESAQEAQAVLRVVRTRHWTIQKCQSWQREHLKTSNPMQERGRGGADDDSENDSVTPILTSTTKASSTTASPALQSSTSHGGGLGKRTQGEYVTNFLIHMLMNTPKVSSPLSSVSESDKDKDQSTTETTSDPSTWATLDPRKHQQPQHDTNAYQRAVDKLNTGTGVVDAAGGSGHVSMALGLAGITSTVVDPRENVGMLPGRDRKIWNRAIRSRQRPLPPPASAITVTDSDASSIPYCQPVTAVQYGTMRAWFGAPPAGVDGTFRQPDKPTEELPVCAVDHPLLSTCSAIIALHPDEATDTIVDTAVAKRIPFVIVPCCVFFRLFPNRRKPGSKDPVSTHADLLEYLMAKDESIQRTTLPFQGANVVLWSSF